MLGYNFTTQTVGLILTDAEKRERCIATLMHDDFGGLTYLLAAAVVDGTLTLERATELAAL